MQVINSNIMSLNAQRNLSNTGADLATSLQRLSSGLRINSAKDDAAGLAISERFTTQIRGMDQAARNANDGISLAQTAEGAMGEIGNNLQRIRELAVQSRNATNSASDREALNKEAQQLKAEIDRVATQTSFNGVKLLDGSFQDQTFQVGANQGETINVNSIVDASSSALGTWAGEPASSGAFQSFTLGTGSSTQTYSMSIDGTLLFYLAASSATIDAADIDSQLGDGSYGRDQLDSLGMTVTGSAAAGTLSFARLDGAAFELTVRNDAGTGGFSSTNFSTGVHSVSGEQTGFADLDISTVEGADNAMLAMDAALNALNTARADMGAVQNRFSSVVANLSSNSENLSAARSRIQDADFAKETAQLTRNQILQQAGTAMLAQANQAPQGVLSLLR